jgi:hypothetical protein
MAIIDLDWHCTGILKVRHPCLMWTFMNYSACWRSKKVLVSTSDVTPLISRQNRVVIVSSVIAKILNPSKCWTVTIKPFWMTLLLISAHCYYLLPVICCFIFVQCLFASVFSFQFNSFVQYSYHPVNVQSPLILEMSSRYFDPVNNNHQQSINIIHQTTPTFVLV